ncbi:hypothetical protein AMECASPLE_014999 [Ameca splendens]|uniref:Uncharacterized protein n=1 Tax=Ameca splendens TaxID=208324 RepID=A0ABV0Y1L5_9TELE
MGQKHQVPSWNIQRVVPTHTGRSSTQIKVLTDTEEACVREELKGGKHLQRPRLLPHHKSTYLDFPGSIKHWGWWKKILFSEEKVNMKSPDGFQHHQHKEEVPLETSSTQNSAGDFIMILEVSSQQPSDKGLLPGE